MSSHCIAQVGIDTPLRTTFDYRIPGALDHVRVGTRVLVPFGRRKVVGLVVRLANTSQVSTGRLKDLQAVLDSEPLLDHKSLSLIEWAANYYQFPLGSALFSALPPMLRKAKQANTGRSEQTAFRWLAVANESADLRRAPKQAAIHRWLLEQASGASPAELNRQFPNCRASISGLEKHGLITRDLTPPVDKKNTPVTVPSHSLQLTWEQQQISQQLCGTLNAFAVHLIEGVTGSGKTEVYFQVIERILADQAGQVLILVPEIGLAPQMLQRLNSRFDMKIGVLHSSVGESERKATWLKICSGDIKIILGTRLAVFTPIPNLKLIIVDEEHDSSFKQHEGFLYHARDVAIYRAQKLKLPIVLGSATPSFESLHNVNLKKYHHHVLANRAQSAVMPTMHLVDMRTERSASILSGALIRAMNKHLRQGKQVILFLNRRGICARSNLP